jgi:hypothetical protein
MKNLIKTTFVITACIIAFFIAGNQTIQAGPISTNILGAVATPPGNSPPYNIMHLTNAPNTTIWIAPPTGATSCVLTNYMNTSGHTWHIYAIRRSDLTLFGPGTNSLAFPVTTTTTYEMNIEDWTKPGTPTGTTVYQRAVWSN